ncbi:hypothetical protein MJO28_009315 [Puccinia striiformis f. sp. tritici]|uniref:Membrane insertase YidC/Oxa/ALB C-terminal domain-containing protein n=2 Tax=Puccinia striiformis f. sp. tritici TaxID=168172 RepID=A0A0L0VWU1_9BASI|nr:hypothetical protein Pst134EA_017750 [Puccinia striiformis f. sp. tritici]KAH9461444.1 hypothetical protein Pst134EA_017750 [Puccinia striiformis f. sp. tritici]KAI7947407.1 hypothetical protein MJO28_009315 [Puccinia striiformis f. sp. tritici]KNF03784.1 hypothetical protein PSTG_02879 [Puccinia striiformis f. sp. tritici PST-78]
MLRTPITKNFTGKSRVLCLDRLPPIRSQSTSSQPLLLSSLVARNPRFIRPSTTTNNLSCLNSKRAYSLWPFGSGTKSPPTVEAPPAPALEKAAEPVVVPVETPSITPPVQPQLDQLLVESTTATASSATQELAALELEHGLIARYTSGSIEQILCALHDQFNLPWYLTIPVVIVGIRTVLIPINVWSMRIGARNMIIKPSLDIKISKIKDFQTKGEQHKAMHAQTELRTYMKQEGFRPLAPLGLPLLQGSLFVSFFWALREMGSNHLPSLTTEGALWFTDLTLAGPWYGLPLFASGLTLLSIETASEMGGLKAGQSQKVMWFLRTVIVGTLWLFHDLPSAVFLYWCTNNMFSLLWGTFIRLIPKSLKLKLGIPDTAAINASQKANPNSPTPSFLDGFKAIGGAPPSDPTPTSTSSSGIGAPPQFQASPPQPILWKKSTTPKKSTKNSAKKPSS